MASLYEIDERLRALENYLVDSETGEIIEDTMEEEVVEEKPRSRRRRA